ncbi:MAG: LpqB family beta-propeller domain-containing protein [Rhodospirillaceae bacterium]|nr:LpqB family beta-propeller domain-containing protein [Rhodospirillaceae bacterium]
MTPDFSRLTGIAVAAVLTVHIGAALAQPGTSSGRVTMGNLVTENVPPVPAGLAQRLQQYANTRSAGIADWSPDGKSLLITTRFGEAAQLHRVDQPMGARRQLTYFDEPIPTGAFAADGQSLLLIRDVGGSEDYQIYVLDLNTGAARVVSDGTARHSMPILSADRKMLAFSSNRRNGRDMDVYVADAAAPEQARMIHSAGGSWQPEAWSPAGEKLAITQSISVAESRIVIIDIATGSAQEIPTASGKAALGEPTFGTDAGTLFYTSDDGSDFTQLRLRDLRTGKDRVLTADVPWDVARLTVSRDGKRLVYVINEDGIDRLRLLDTKSLKPLPAPAIPDGQVTGLRFSPDGDRLAIGVTTATAPSDVYVYALKGKALTRWTESEVGGLNPARFVAAETVRYPSFDAVDGKPRQIPALVYTPKDRPGPHPVLVQIHGGPEGQERPSFVAETQAFVNELGIAVIKPNVRGSTGYGKDFQMLDNGLQREDSVKDIGALLDWIGTQLKLDAKRVMVYGGSYGGFMTLASLVAYNDRLAGGIDVVGISNFITFLNNTRGYRQDLRRVEYGDERDPMVRAFFERISPLNNAAKITKPLMVVQGLNDPRVPAGESEQMVAAVKANGGVVWYVQANDEGHGFRKKSNRAYQQQAMFMFLERYLIGGATN